MNTSYHFAANAAWTEGRHGVVKGEAGRPQLEFSAPPEFQGQAGFWTPEHFFLAAVATCFITTFRAIEEFSKFDVEALEVGVEGTVGKGEGGFHFTRVVVRPLLTLHLEADRERALRLLEKAERSCLVLAIVAK
jgi:peroxiredoxin-like protein